MHGYTRPISVPVPSLAGLGPVLVSTTTTVTARTSPASLLAHATVLRSRRISSPSRFSTRLGESLLATFNVGSYLHGLYSSGTLANVVGGFNYVKTAAASTGRPSIASASLGGGASTAIDDAVTALVASGVHTVVAAGNSNVNAANTSPARVATAITVGAHDINDAKASFSNYGAVVDIWAPGVSITSAGYVSNTATIVYSGTSQATPHVSGIAAAYISKLGNTTPAALSAALWSQTGKITGIPSGPNRNAVLQLLA